MHVVAVNRDNGLNEKELDLFEEIIGETCFVLTSSLPRLVRCSDSPVKQYVCSRIEMLCLLVKILSKQYVCSRIEMLCLLVKILSHASAKKKTKKLPLLTVFPS